MNKHIIKTEFDSMYQCHIDLYTCPCCGENPSHPVLAGRWYTENFTRITCAKCQTYIYIVSKNFDPKEIETF